MLSKIGPTKAMKESNIGLQHTTLINQSTISAIKKKKGSPQARINGITSVFVVPDCPFAIT